MKCPESRSAWKYLTCWHCGFKYLSSFWPKAVFKVLLFPSRNSLSLIPKIWQACKKVFEIRAQLHSLHKLWSVKKETDLNSIFCLIKSSEIDFIFLPAFYLIMFLMTSSKNFEKIAILKNDSLFSSEVSKLTSVKYPWIDAFSGMKFTILTNIAPLIVIVLTKCSLYCF